MSSEEMMHGRLPAHRGTDDERLYLSLRENDRRRYAAVESTKLGHGGIEYISHLLGCDPKTIRQGMSELEAEDELDSERVRKKGEAGTK
jgi:hypothetical protein